MVMDDDELIAAIASGDGEDVLQETFIAVWRNANTYQPRGTPAARRRCS